jgi:hypothetical protein
VKHVKTSAGFEADIDEGFANDMELLELLVQVEQKNMRALLDIINKILSPDQKAALYDFIRDDNGRVPVDQVTGQVFEIVEILGGKNS